MGVPVDAIDSDGGKDKVEDVIQRLIVGGQFISHSHPLHLCSLVPPLFAPGFQYMSLGIVRDRRILVAPTPR